MRLTTPQAWTGEAIERLRGGEITFASAHLDELGLRLASWAEAVDAFRLVIAAVPAAWSGRVSLALPLEESPNLRTAPPSDPEQMSAHSEPPSIYLFAPAYFARNLGDGEEYRVRIVLDYLAEGALAEFVSSRDAASASKSWDFVNTVWVHHLPGGER